MAVRFVGGKIRIELRGESEGMMARLMFRTWESFIGSPVLGTRVALRTYSILDNVPFILAGRCPGRRKLNGKSCSPIKLIRILRVKI